MTKKAPSLLGEQAPQLAPCSRKASERRLLELQTMIRNNTYHVPTEELANKLIAVMLRAR